MYGAILRDVRAMYEFRTLVLHIFSIICANAYMNVQSFSANFALGVHWIYVVSPCFSMLSARMYDHVCTMYGVCKIMYARLLPAC
jgi:hypothetical protein